MRVWSTATIQRLEVTHEQISTLFWVNAAVGVMLAILCAASAPLVVAFYHEPRLYWVAVVSGTTFIFNGLASQHAALLTRRMRFVTQANIGVLSLLVGSATGIVMALLGYRYWSLVGMALSGSICRCCGCMDGGSLDPRAPAPQMRCPVDASFRRGGNLQQLCCISGLEHGETPPWSFLGSGCARTVWAGLPACHFTGTTIERCGHQRGFPRTFADSA